MLYTVELDYSGSYQTEVEADSAESAKKQAEEELKFDNGTGDRMLRRVESFQVYDEKMQPCDVGK